MVKTGYKQTEIGVIPEDWEIKYLSDFGKIQSGGTPSTTMAEYWGGNIAWCTPSDITSTPTKYINVTERTITEAGLNNSAATVMPAGSILLCTRATIGELKINSIPMATNQGFKNITVNNSGNAEFLYYLLQTKKSRMLDLAIGSTFLEISKTALSKILLQIPMRDEQNKIADALSDMDNLVVVLEKQIAKKKAIKQGAMQELLTGKCRLPGFSGEWETFVFGDLFDFISNNAFTRAQLSDSGKVKNIHYGDILTKFGAYISADSNEIPYIEREIDLSRFAEKSYLQSGDIVIADTAEDETVGKALEVINVECPVLAGQHTLLCRPKVRFSEKFLGYYLNAACYHDQLLPFIVGTKVSSISKASVAQTRLAMPKYEEQQAISCILSDMDDDITELEKKLAKYRQIKQGMMQQLLTGKIRLKNDVEELVQAEQANAVKTLPARTAHNRQFDDAVSIAAIVDAFYSDKYPLGRVKVQKLLYLLHRHQAVSVSDFKKKAAGPYADTVRYKGGEPIAKKNKYIVSENGKQGTRYSRGENMAQALNYVERWGMQSDLQWLKENFLHTGRNDLELFATVDMAICDLNEAGVPISVASIKDLIASSKEWKAKLSKTYFSDRDIARAIKKCTELFN